jgi:hypothetical protein
MQASRGLRARLAGRALAALLVVSLVWLGGVVPAARAAVVTTEAALATPAGDTDRAHVAAFLDREDVRTQLESFGVDTDQARERVALLTDEEAAQLAGKLAELPAGGSAALAIAIIALIIAVVILLELIGVIDIFPGMGRRA